MVGLLDDDCADLICEKQIEHLAGMGTMGTTGCMKGEMSSVVVQQGSVGVIVEAGAGVGDGA